MGTDGLRISKSGPCPKKTQTAKKAQALLNLLIVGSGAREHVLAWKFSQSSRVDRIFTAPGNAGTATLGDTIAVDALDFEGLAAVVQSNRIDLVVVGPEDPLAAGIVDDFQGRGIPIFGPSKEAAVLESSKSFAKDLMRRHGIPCARGEKFTSFEDARKYVEGLAEPPVVKADGLTAGKGVVVAESTAQAVDALKNAMVSGTFGEAGRRVVIEERLVGLEASVFGFTDGKTVLATIPACDYKRALDGDIGPNTGGMGSYSPPEFLDDAMLQRITDTILVPTVRAMEAEGKPYKGVLYAGLIIVEGEPKVIEFNCRLGDPETQVILPRMKTDLLDIMQSSIDGTLHREALEWTPGACVGVVMASGGYPGSYKTGYPISGLDEIGPDALVFHAGTRSQDSVPMTAGGRVLTVTALGRDVAQARDRVYEKLERIEFRDAQYRRDIGLRAVAGAA